MSINIKTSEANQEVIKQLTSKLPAGTKENVIARIALGYSLKTGRKFSPSEFSRYDSQGKEYKEHILFDEKYKDFYIALVCQYYGIYKSDENLPKYIKLHIDHGLEEMGNLFRTSPNYTFMDFLKDNLDAGISMMDRVSVPQGFVKSSSQNIEKSYFNSAIKINIGNSLDEVSQDIQLELNNTVLHHNSHMAIAGCSGAGKTQFALYLLREICEKSNHTVKFIYLDFKGLNSEDKEKMSPFFERTGAKLIDVKSTPFPINPLSFIDSINETNRRMGIDKFVDIVAKYSNIGYKQQATLREATIEAFKDKKSGQHPSLMEINDKLLEIVGDKKDSLTEIIDQLSAYNIFQEDKNGTHFLNQNIYLSLSGDLPQAIRFTSLFLIINYIYNVFMNMENAPVEGDTAALRYVLLIDEAHVVFKERKYQEILERLLREIRSKGVSIVLLSQGIDEFNQQSFDFSSMCDITFLMDIKDKNNTGAINKFMGISDKDGNIAYRSMEKIASGQAISNIKEYTKGKLFEVKQYYKD